MSKVSFIKSTDRKYNIERCLSLIKSEVVNGLKEAKRVVVKPNCVTDNNQLAATNVEALRAVLEFIQPHTKCQITVAEGCVTGRTLNAFKNFGYLKLQDEFDFTIVDLNDDEFATVNLLDKDNKTQQAEIAKTILESDYLISISPPKTHNEAVYTGAIKNATVGSLLRPTGGLAAKFAGKLGIAKNNKSLIHREPKVINENIRRLYKYVPLRLAVLDGFEAMEGDGPINGKMVPTHFAIASSDPLAADWLACQLMGISVDDVGYLSLLEAGRNEYFVAGDTWRDKISQFKMHKDFNKIRQWR